jgi:hypothetical protein
LLDHRHGKWMGFSGLLTGSAQWDRDRNAGLPKCEAVIDGVHLDGITFAHGSPSTAGIGET